MNPNLTRQYVVLFIVGGVVGWFGHYCVTKPAAPLVPPPAPQAQLIAITSWPPLVTNDGPPEPGPGPGPTPTPDPKPTPTPAPVNVIGAKLNVIMVHDPATDTPSLATLLESPTLKTALTAAGHQHFNSDVNLPKWKLPGWQKTLTKAGVLPALILQNQTDKAKWDAMPLPKSEADIVAAVKKASGT